MKKLLLIATIACLSHVSFAQLKIGAGATLGTRLNINDEIGVGVNIRANYTFNPKLSLSTGFTYVIPSKYSNFKNNSWQANADLHYTFYNKNDLSLYGLAGINYGQIKTTEETVSTNSEYLSFESTSYSSSKNGLNIGAGIGYKRYFGEVKYDSFYKQLGLTLGVIF